MVCDYRFYLSRCEDSVCQNGDPHTYYIRGEGGWRNLLGKSLGEPGVTPHEKVIATGWRTILPKGLQTANVSNLLASFHPQPPLYFA